MENYKSKKEVGNGSYGDVWLCIDKASNRQVAIKKSISGVSRDLLINEYEILASLSDDCIIKPITCYVDDESSQMVLPYYKKDIYDYSENKPRVKDDALKTIALRLGKAIKYAHGMDIIHRDIKPENIMFNNSLDDCVLIDWGLSDYVEDIDTNVLTGSYGYMAPEVADVYYNKDKCSWKVGKPSDMFSIGSTLYTVASKEQIIYMDDGESMRKIISNDPTNLINALDRSDDFKDLLHRLMERNPDKRITAEQMLKHKYFVSTI